MNMVAFANLKGGVGKTTLSYMFALIAHSELKKKILVVDLDPQANLTQIMLSDLEVTQTLNAGRLLTSFVRTKEELKMYIIPTKYPGIDIIPAHLSMARLEQEFYHSVMNLSYLRNLLGLVDKYAFVVLDSPPNLGIFTTLSLATVDVLFIPVSVDVFAVEALRQMFEFHRQVQAKVNPNLRIGAVIINLIDRRSVTHRTIAQAVASAVPHSIPTLQLGKRVALQKIIGTDKPLQYLLQDFRASKEVNSVFRQLIDIAQEVST